MPVTCCISGQMFMHLRKTVLSGAVELVGAFLCFVFGNHGFAAAAVSRQAVSGEGIIGSNDTQMHQWICRRNEPCGVTAGVGNAFGLDDGFSVCRRKFREAVSPTFCRSVSGAGINDAGIGVFHQMYGFFCRRVRQAKENNIRQIHEPFPFGFVFSFFFCDEQQFHAVVVGQLFLKL